MSTVILAKSPREANVYARDKGIRASYAPNAAAVRAADHIIELASFSERRDRFEMLQAAKAQARFIRGTKYVRDLDWTAPEKIVEEPNLASQVAPETWLFGDVPVQSEPVFSETEQPAELNTPLEELVAAKESGDIGTDELNTPVEPAEEPAPSTPSPKKAPVKRNPKKKAAKRPGVGDLNFTQPPAPEADPEVEF